MPPERGRFVRFQLAPAAVRPGRHGKGRRATGRGLGYQMLEAANASDFDFLWAAVILVTLFAFLVYNVVATAERFLVSRYHEA